ncbi:MAG: hypothetical protein JO253_03620 [Alphaproteobacteria bacterium]|nr:hypothetical protein [Alphaproteobacteria bacterium]
MTTALVTLSDVKLYKGIANTDTTYDALITALIPECLAAMNSYCSRNFASQAYQEIRDGNNKQTITAVGYPITAVSSVFINGTNIAAGNWNLNGVPVGGNATPTNGFLFSVGSRRISLYGYQFTQGVQNVVLNYTGGYGDASGQGGADLAPWPQDLKMAICMYIWTRINERARLGIGSKSLAGESITYDAGSGTSAQSKGIPAAAMAILDAYRNVVPEVFA